MIKCNIDIIFSLYVLYKIFLLYNIYLIEYYRCVYAYILYIYIWEDMIGSDI